MKWSMERSALVQPLELLGKVVSTKSDRPIYTNITICTVQNKVIFEGFCPAGSLRVISDDVKSGFWSDGEVNISYDSIAPLMKTLNKTDVVIFELKDSVLNVQAIREDKKLFDVDLPITGAEFSPLQIEDTEEVPTFAWTPEELKQVFSLCDKKDFGFRHRGVFFSGKHVFGGAPDGLGILEGPDVGEKTYIIDPSVVDVLDKLDTSHIQFAENAARLFTQDELTEYHCRYVVSPVPKVAQFLEDIEGPKATLSKTVILDALKQAQALSTTDNHMAEFKFTADKLEIQNKSMKRGKGKFFVPIESEQEMSIELGLPSMIKAISAFNGDTIIFQPSESMGFIALRQDKFSVIIPKG